MHSEKQCANTYSCVAVLMARNVALSIILIIGVKIFAWLQFSQDSTIYSVKYFKTLHTDRGGISQFHRLDR